jgi:hypothetical protein
MGLVIPSVKTEYMSCVQVDYLPLSKTLSGMTTPGGFFICTQEPEGVNLSVHGLPQGTIRGKGEIPERVQGLLHRRFAGLLPSSTMSRTPLRKNL